MYSAGPHAKTLPMTKSRFLNGAEASRRFGVLAGTYAASLMRADPLADAAVEALHPFHGRWWPMVLKALEEGIEAVPDAPPELGTLLASLPPPPSAEQWQIMDRGSAAVARTGDRAALVLQCASLMIDYWSSAAIKPLVLTGNIAQQTLHRLAETGAWWIELHRPGGLRNDQDGYKTTVHVRLIHAFVRRMALGSVVWDRAAWGAPINQGDLFFQVVGFSRLMIASLERMGCDFTAAEKEGYYAFWRHVAALLGVDSFLLPLVNEPDCGRFRDLWMLTNPGPDEESIALARTTLDTLATVGGKTGVARGLQHSILCGTTRWLLGQDIGEGLKVPRTAVGDWVPRLYPAMTRLSARLSRGDRAADAARAIERLSIANAAVGVPPKGTGVVSEPARLEALAKFKPVAPPRV